MVIRGEGQLKKAMAIIASGAILNIILDPIFITVLKPYGLGVEAAAYATIFSQFIQAVITLWYFKKKSVISHTQGQPPRQRLGTISTGERKDANSIFEILNAKGEAVELNNNAGQATYADKRQKYYLESNYDWVKNFIDEHTSWTEEDVLVRAENMADIYYHKNS